MKAVKFISFEMRVEFDIGETDYHVVWSSDEGKKQEKEIDEAKEETKDKSEFPTNFKSENDENKEDPTNMDNLVENEKNEEKEETEQNNTGENNADEPNLMKQEDDDSTADDDNQYDSQQVSDKKVDEENKSSEDPMAINKEGGFTVGNELWMKRGTDGKTGSDDIDETEDMEEKNCQEEATLPENESPGDDDGVKSSLLAKEAEESTENKEDDVRQYILELGAGPRRIILSRKSSESSTPVFGQSTEGLNPEEMKNFGEAWAEAAFLCLERRVAAGHTVDEVTQGLVEELGPDKFQEIVEHFLGTITVEHSEAEDGPEENGNEASDEQK